MITTYTFKPEFEEKLGSDKDKFIRNLKKVNRLNNDICCILNNLTTFKDFIYGGFIWNDETWKEIAKR